MAPNFKDTQRGKEYSPGVDDDDDDDLFRPAKPKGH